MRNRDRQFWLRHPRVTKMDDLTSLPSTLQIFENELEYYPEHLTRYYYSLHFFPLSGESNVPTMGWACIHVQIGLTENLP